MLNFGFNTKIVMTKAVERAVAKAAPKNLKEAGRYVRGVTRSLIKQRRDPNKSSAPGRSPHSHASGFNKGFKRTIASALNDKYSVVIGPKLVRTELSEISRVHEFGGTRRVRDVPEDLRDGVHIGDVAPITVKYFSKKKDTIIKKDIHTDPRTGREVVWVRIRTKSQALHSQRLFNRMMRKYARKVNVYYPARPFMRPALRLSKSKLSKFWYYSVRSI